MIILMKTKTLSVLRENFIFKRVLDFNQRIKQNLLNFRNHFVPSEISLF